MSEQPPVVYLEPENNESSRLVVNNNVPLIYNPQEPDVEYGVPWNQVVPSVSNGWIRQDLYNTEVKKLPRIKETAYQRIFFFITWVVHIMEVDEVFVTVKKTYNFFPCWNSYVKLKRKDAVSWQFGSPPLNSSHIIAMFILILFGIGGLSFGSYLNLMGLYNIGPAITAGGVIFLIVDIIILIVLLFRPVVATITTTSNEQIKFFIVSNGMRDDYAKENEYLERVGEFILENVTEHEDIEL